MWAASSALRTVGVKVGDVRFKMAARTLCREVCIAWNTKGKSSNGSTSDTLLALAMDSLQSVVGDMWPPPSSPPDPQIAYTFVKEPPAEGHTRFPIGSACLVIASDQPNRPQDKLPSCTTLLLHSTQDSLDLYVPDHLSHRLAEKREQVLEHLATSRIHGQQFVYSYVKDVSSLKVVLQTPHSIKVGVPFDLIPNGDTLDTSQIAQRVTDIITDITWTK